MLNECSYDENKTRRQDIEIYSVLPYLLPNRYLKSS